uniref:Uncharacterized protein n=1 Tax=Setaria viridis TaxID=4556 RepID=A0A4U6TUP6_SETVI|nr:hypothetical protein SEVIR_7G136300v2 [Setaria viridis]
MAAAPRPSPVMRHLSAAALRCPNRIPSICESIGRRRHNSIPLQRVAAGWQVVAGKASEQSRSRGNEGGGGVPRFDSSGLRGGATPRAPMERPGELRQQCPVGGGVASTAAKERPSERQRSRVLDGRWRRSPDGGGATPRAPMERPGELRQRCPTGGGAAPNASGGGDGSVTRPATATRPRMAGRREHGEQGRMEGGDGRRAHNCLRTGILCNLWYRR